MLSKELSQLALDAEDLYWYALWLRLPRIDKRRYPATKAFAQKLPQLFEKIASYPYIQWVLHKRLLNLEFSIEESEWSILSSLLVNVGISTDQIQLNEKGHLLFNRHFYELLTTISQQIQQLQVLISKKQQKALFDYLPWLDNSYRRAISNRKLLIWLSGYLGYYLNAYQKLNQPWREPYTNIHQAEFVHLFHAQSAIWQRLNGFGKRLRTAFCSFQVEQLNALIDAYQQKTAAIGHAVTLLYEAGSVKKMPNKDAQLIASNLSYRQLAQTAYSEPLIRYTDLVELLRGALPKQSTLKNMRQQIELTEKINNLNVLLSEQPQTAQAAQKSSKLNINIVYLRQVALLIQDMTDYLVKALVVNKDIFSYYVKYLLSILEPSNEVLKDTDLACRLVIANLALLSLREVIKYCARSLLSEETGNQVIALINAQLDVIKLRLFI